MKFWTVVIWAYIFGLSVGFALARRASNPTGPFNCETARMELVAYRVCFAVSHQCKAVPDDFILYYKLKHKTARLCPIALIRDSVNPLTE